jgi:hypothetical protein
MWGGILLTSSAALKGLLTRRAFDRIDETSEGATKAGDTVVATDERTPGLPLLGGIPRARQERRRKAGIRPAPTVLS